MVGRVLFLAAVLLVPSCGHRELAPVPDPLPDTENLGGPATVRDDGVTAFSFPAPMLGRLERRAFAVGNAFFRDNWVEAPASAAGRDGLGPFFNALSCSGCHANDGRGRPPRPEEGDAVTGFLVRLGQRAGDGTEGPHPTYGGQLGDRAVPGVAPEARVTIRWVEEEGRYADSARYTLVRPDVTLVDPGYGPFGEGLLTSPRTGPHLAGMGLLEAIDEATLLALEDPDDRDGDGISGRVNRVLDVRTGRRRPGRFGWKAGQPTVEQQVAAAFVNDIGITSPVFPAEAIEPAQRVTFTSGGSPEIDQHKLGRVTFYCQAIAVPARRNTRAPDVVAGHRLFHRLGCARCHVETMRTGKYDAIPAFSNVVIHPYTDLLLHDMGEGLADGRREGDASGAEWRTAPLWGIGLFEAVSGHTRYLHDGRARNLEEAVLWHGGEAEASREAFKALRAEERRRLLAFLESL